MSLKFRLKILILISIFICSFSYGNFDHILDELEAFAQEQMELHNVPGMQYCIVYNDQILYINSFGIKALGSQSLVNNQTIFEIGSLSKAFTTTLFAKFIDQGLFSWNTKVKEIFPSFQMGDQWVTDEFLISDLFTANSGMPYLALDLMALLGFPPENIIDSLQYVTTANSFRSRFSYINSIYLVASKLLEITTSQTYQDLITQHIFIPLQMNDTTVYADEIENLANRASGHMVTQSGLWVIPPDWRYRHTLYTLMPAGGIHSNIIDMAEWLKFQINRGNLNGEQIISEENILFTYRGITFTERDVADNVHLYGLGWENSDISPLFILSHGGNTLGMRSAIGIIPEAGLGIVVLTNTNNNPVPHNILSKLYQLCFYPEPDRNTVFTLPEKPDMLDKLNIPSAQPKNNYKANNYTGLYRNPAYGNVLVSSQGNFLSATIGYGEHKITNNLTFIGNDNFLFNLPDLPDAMLLFNFQRIFGGRAIRVKIFGFDDVNQGHFRRVL